jgi:hypothetical protein
MELSSTSNSPMESVDLLLDLSIDDGLSVILDAVASGLANKFSNEQGKVCC